MSFGVGLTVIALPEDIRTIVAEIKGDALTWRGRESDRLRVGRASSISFPTTLDAHPSKAVCATCAVRPDPGPAARVKAGRPSRCPAQLTRHHTRRRRGREFHPPQILPHTLQVHRSCLHVRRYLRNCLHRPFTIYVHVRPCSTADICAIIGGRRVPPRSRTRRACARLIRVFLQHVPAPQVAPGECRRAVPACEGVALLVHCRMALEVFLRRQRVHSRLAGRGAEIIPFDGQVCMRW